MQQEECRSGRACSAGRRGRRVRSGAGQVIGRVGGAVRWWMVQARCREWSPVSVCLRLKLTSGRAWERETNTEVPRPLPTNRRSTIESMGQSPHCPRSQANCDEYSHHARSSDIMQECPGLSAVWYIHYRLSTYVHMPRYGPCSRHSGARAVSP